MNTNTKQKSRRIVELDGVRFRMDEQEEDQNESQGKKHITWRKILSPAQEQMIDSGKYELINHNEQLYNIDSIIPDTSEENIQSQSDEPHFRLRLRKVEMPYIWIGNFPKVSNIAFFFLVKSDINIDTYREVIKKLRNGGFVAAGFRDIEDLKKEVNEKRHFLNGMEAFGVSGDCNSFKELSVFHTECIKTPKPIKFLLGCFTSEVDQQEYDDELLDEVLPSSINLSAPIDSICERVIRSLNYDLNNYPFCYSSKLSEKQEQVKEKSLELVSFIRPVGKSYSEFGECITKFLRDYDSFANVKHGLKYDAFNKYIINKNPVLNSLGPEFRSKLFEDEINNLRALKKALDRREYYYV